MAKNIFNNEPYEKPIIVIPIAILLFSLLGWIVYQISQVLISGSDVSKTIAGGVIAIIVAIASHAFAKHYEYRNTVKVESRAKRIPVYEEFIRFMLKDMLLNKGGTMKEAKIISFFADFTPKLALWGNDEVFRAYLDFRSFGLSNVKEKNTDILFLFEDVVWKMRQDLGYKNNGLNKGDVIKMFVTDYSTLEKKT